MLEIILLLIYIVFRYIFYLDIPNDSQLVYIALKKFLEFKCIFICKYSKCYLEVCLRGSRQPR
jgi:hypothetical protein